MKDSDIENIVIEYLKDKNIEYKIVHAIYGSIYIKTNNGTIRISDHIGQNRNYDDVILFFVTYEKTNKEIIINSLDCHFIKKNNTNYTIGGL